MLPTSPPTKISPSCTIFTTNKFVNMSSIPRDEIIFGFTENEVKFLILSLKCIEAHGNRLFVSIFLSRPLHLPDANVRITS